MIVGIYGEGECCAAKALILPVIKIIKLFPFKKSIKHMFCLVEVQLVCVLESWSNGWCRLMADGWADLYIASNSTGWYFFFGKWAQSIIATGVWFPVGIWVLILLVCLSLSMANAQYLRFVQKCPNKQAVQFLINNIYLAY